jgi:hypothetical protein
MEALMPEELMHYTFTFSVATLIVALFALLYQMIDTKVGVAGIPSGGQKGRFTFSFWLVTMFFLFCVVVAILIFKTRLPGGSSAGKNTNSPTTPPCPDDRGKNANEKKREPVSQDAHAPVKGAREFLIDTMSYERSPFAVMGTFSGVARRVDKGIEIAIPNPIFRVATYSRDGSTPRIITSVRVGMGAPTELAKIAAGRRGLATWSASFPLNLEVEPGAQPISGPQIFVKVPTRPKTEASNRSVIIEIKNTARDSGIQLATCYAYSKGAVALN